MTEYMFPTGTRLEGKVALITGGARGIGGAITQAFSAQGTKVMIGDILEDTTRVLVSELGDWVAFVRLDATDRAALDAAAELAVDGGEMAGPGTVWSSQ
jgi:3alpha(or 20beta)-hydroxysteroid dehydrogenase